MYWSCWVIVILVGTLLCVMSSVYSEDDFGVILDAGSSGTKLKVYKWKRTEHVTDIPIMDIIHGEKFTPGVGKYTRRQSDLAKYLTAIVVKAKQLVPEDRRASTPIYLMATAGARILDGNIALGLLNHIRNVLSNRTINPFRFSGRNVRILSGEEEGVFAWVALNALNGFFNSSDSPRESLGILEMGGGSTQIAFVPHEPIYAGEFQVFIGGRLYGLYVHSYLFFGVNYMKERVYNYLADMYPGDKHIHNPCMLRGHNATYMIGDMKVVYMGGSDPDECLAIIRHFLKKATGDYCQPKPCGIGSVYQPRVSNISFYATQSFVYTPQTMNSLDSLRHLNISKLQMEAHRYCKKGLKEILADPYYEVLEKFASNECLMGLYMPELFLESYQLDPEVNSITVTNKLYEFRIDWTMGALLYELSSMFRYKRLFPRTEIIPCPAQETADEPEVPYTPVNKASMFPTLDSNCATPPHSAFLQTIYVSLLPLLFASFH